MRRYFANFAPAIKMIENKRLCKKYLQIGLGLDVDKNETVDRVHLEVSSAKRHSFDRTRGDAIRNQR